MVDLLCKLQWRSRLVYCFAFVQIFLLSSFRAAFIAFLKCFAYDFKVQFDLCTGTLSGPDAALEWLLAFNGLVAMIQFESPPHGSNESTFLQDPCHILGNLFFSPTY